ncbi:hypothetical protein KKC88_00330 [Patescibacteria group bacterium]|nr:hypothetical protein [Patescibacteria group bacterium]MBU1672911.1 hypothetical protein [Patescibacteria group bacterium]MBU1963382.1 hypothetical protein [Patescibacteria group bacterium]
MRLYYYSTTESDIPAMLKDAGIDVWQKPSDANLSLIDQTGLSFLEQVDGMVLEISDPDQQINYFLAQAILQRKPTLCLYKKNQNPRQLLTYLRNKNIPEEIIVNAYTSSTLEKYAADFLKSLGLQEEKEETPNIKFTLRITSKIESYLNWKAKHEKINKADYIRKLISEEINKDNKFNQNNEKK